MKNRGFIIHGVKFWLNDNRALISKSNYEFFPKYKLMIDRGGWMETGYCFDTKKSAMEYAKEMIKKGLW